MREYIYVVLWGRKIPVENIDGCGAYGGYTIYAKSEHKELAFNDQEDIVSYIRGEIKKGGDGDRGVFEFLNKHPTFLSLSYWGQEKILLNQDTFFKVVFYSWELACVDNAFSNYERAWEHAKSMEQLDSDIKMLVIPSYCIKDF